MNHVPSDLLRVITVYLPWQQVWAMCQMGYRVCANPLWRQRIDAEFGPEETNFYPLPFFDYLAARSNHTEKEVAQLKKLPYSAGMRPFNLAAELQQMQDILLQQLQTSWPQSFHVHQITYPGPVADLAQQVLQDLIDLKSQLHLYDIVIFTEIIKHTLFFPTENVTHVKVIVVIGIVVANNMIQLHYSHRFQEPVFLPIAFFQLQRMTGLTFRNMMALYNVPPAVAVKLAPTQLIAPLITMSQEQFLHQPVDSAMDVEIPI